MKDKIKEIFDSELFVCMEKDICGLQRAADQLTELMCHHAVKALFGYIGGYYINLPSVYNKVYNVLIIDYPPILVIACLQKFKNEQK